MFFTIAEIIVCLLLIGAIMLQMQGSGFSTGGGEMYRSKRSVEKVLIYATIVFSILFAIISMVLVFQK